MAINRRDMLEEFLRQHPEDAFARYGLAMDLMGAGDSAAALEQFRLLRERHPGYIAAYHQAGQLLIALDCPADARTILEDGITAAAQRGDSHAQAEMRGLLDELDERGA